MTRDDVLTLYRPIRASIRTVLGLAVGACGGADITRAAKQLGLWSDGDIPPVGEEAAEMLCDIALFEPNQRGRRVFDGFLVGARARQLGAHDLALAHRMGGAVFSLFRCAGRHEMAGVWLDDLLDGDGCLHLVDEGLEASATEGVVLGMRLFDAGPFHAGFGIVVQPDEEVVEMCARTHAATGRSPFRHSLAATLYGDAICETLPPSREQERILQLLLEGLITDPVGVKPGEQDRAVAREPGPERRTRRSRLG